MKDQEPKTKPVETHRDGRLTAAIWENQGEHGKIYNATLTYSYQDKEGNWRDTTSIPGKQLLKASRLQEMSYATVLRLQDRDRQQYIEQQKTQAGQTPDRDPARDR